MDGKEKVARLEAWLKAWFSADKHILASTTAEERRAWSAVEHELLRQTDKKIIEELGLLDE